MRKLAHLPDRTVIAITGADRVSFLQGLVSNDVAQAQPGRAVWTALLTPQGKYLADFFVRAAGDALLLDAMRGDAEMIAAKLRRFRLRAAVEIGLLPLAVHALWDGMPDPEMDAVPDPRLAEAGFRVLASSPLETNAGPDEYDRHRLLLGLPDGARDMEVEKSVLLEAGFDELHGVSWTKGCYLGQELTARTKYRGLLKRRLVPVTATAPATLPAPGTPLLVGGRDAGTMRSSRDELGLALVRLEHLHAALEAPDGARLHARVPDWMRLPAAPAETA